MLTTAQAAEILGVTSSRVRQLIREGVISAPEKFGEDHMIDPAEVERAKGRRGPGRPKKDGGKKSRKGH